MDSQQERQLVGVTLGGRYLIQLKVGAGGNASVYKAHDKTMNRDVAIKVLHSTKAIDPDAVKRLVREAQVLANLKHDNIMVVHTCQFEADGTFYLVEDFLDGENLGDRLKRSGPLSLDEFKQVFSQVCAGLRYAHSKGLVHRDIKPSNIMLMGGADGKIRVQILDFGLARQVDPSTVQKLTATATIVGSFNYMSPEQCSGSDVDERTDIYALACTMHEALSGEAPYSADSAFAILYRHSNETLPPLSGEKMAATSSILQKSTSVDPNNRFQSVAAMWEAIESGETASVSSPVRAKRGSKGLLLVIGACVGVLIAAGAGVVLLRRETPVQTPGSMDQAHISPDQYEKDLYDQTEAIIYTKGAPAAVQKLQRTVADAEDAIHRNWIPPSAYGVYEALDAAYGILEFYDKASKRKGELRRRELALQLAATLPHFADREYDVVCRSSDTVDRTLHNEPSDPDHFVDKIADAILENSPGTSRYATCGHLLKAQGLAAEHERDKATKELNLALPSLMQRMRAYPDSCDLRLALIAEKICAACEPLDDKMKAQAREIAALYLRAVKNIDNSTLKGLGRDMEGYIREFK